MRRKWRGWCATAVLTVVLASGGGDDACAQADPSCLLDPPDQSADVPDDGYIDANGDGIDGMRCGPIFVAPTGSDSDIGTIDAPMRTIGAAISAARSHTPPRDVYIADGVYEGMVVLAEGVDLYGGYDAEAGWSRSLASRATIHLGPNGAGDVPLLAINPAEPALVDHLILEPDRDPMSQIRGTTNAAALVSDCSGRALAAGIYYVRLTAGERTLTQRAVLLR